MSIKLFVCLLLSGVALSLVQVNNSINRINEKEYEFNWLRY